MTLCIHNARIVGPEGVLPGGVLAGDGGRIAAVLGRDDRPAAEHVIDGAQRFLFPGFVDADCRNGGDGFATAAIGGVTTAACANPSRPTFTDLLPTASGVAGFANPFLDLNLTDRAARRAKIAAMRDGAFEGVCSGDLPANIYAAALLDLAVRGAIGWPRACELLSTTPARQLGIGDRKGRIAPGLDADLVLVDDFATRIVPQNAPPTPFDGFAFRGWPMLTVLRGRIVAENEKLAAASPSGRVLTTGG